MSTLNSNLIPLTEMQISYIDDVIKNALGFNNNKTKVYLFRNLQKKLGFETGITNPEDKVNLVTKPIFKYELEEEIWEMIHGKGYEIKRFITFLKTFLPHSNLKGGVPIKSNAKIVMAMILDKILVSRYIHTETELNNFGYSMLFAWSIQGYNKEMGDILIEVVSHWLNGTYNEKDHPDFLTLLGIVNEADDFKLPSAVLDPNEALQVGIKDNQCIGVLTGLTIIDLLLLRLVYMGGGDIQEIIEYLSFTYGTSFKDYEFKWGFIYQFDQLLSKSKFDMGYIQKIRVAYNNSQPVKQDRYEPCIDNVK